MDELRMQQIAILEELYDRCIRTEDLCQSTMENLRSQLDTHPAVVKYRTQQKELADAVNGLAGELFPVGTLLKHPSRYVGRIYVVGHRVRLDLNTNYIESYHINTAGRIPRLVEYVSSKELLEMVQIDLDSIDNGKLRRRVRRHVLELLSEDLFAGKGNSEEIK